LGEIPKSYYITNKKPQPTEDMTCIAVSKGSRYNLELDVRYANTTIRWKFLSEDADIGFHIYFFNGKEKVDLIPFERVNAHIMMEEGMVMSSHAATHFVEFDNSYSYIRSKKIWFSVNTEELEHTKKVTPVLNDQVEKAFKQYYNTKIARTVKW